MVIRWAVDCRAAVVRIDDDAGENRALFALSTGVDRTNL